MSPRAEAFRSKRYAPRWSAVTQQACEGLFTPNAEADLDDIRRWISRDNRPRAISFTRELAAKAESLAEGALLYPEVDPRMRPGVRRLNHREYRILYSVDGDTVRILHIHHGRRRYP